MKDTPSRIGCLRSAARATAAIGLVIGLIVWVAGCPSDSGSSNSNDNGGTSDVEAEVVSFSTNFAVSLLDSPPSVIYTVTNAPTDATISGLRLPVADNSPGAAPIGDPAVVAIGLPSGVNQSYPFPLCPSGTTVCDVSVGFYRAGILVAAPGMPEIEDYSGGVIQVQGPPNPQFYQPSEDINEVEQGDEVAVNIDVGDPENNVQWRLFYLTSADSLSVPADQLGTQIAIGSGNVVSTSVSTANLTVGDYQLGISATDSGLSVASTVASGLAERIVTIPSGSNSTPVVRVLANMQPLPPTIVVTAPGAADVPLFRDEEFTIQFTANIREPGATGTVDLYVDTDSNPNNGFSTLIVERLPASNTSYPLPTNLAEGSYFVVAIVTDAINSPVTAYSVGKISVVRTVTLAVTAPDSPLPIAPSTPGGTQNAVAVEWTTNLPPTAGMVDVFARTVSSAGCVPGSAFGPEIPVLPPSSPSVMSASFSSATSGLFEITVRLTLTDGTIEAIDAAPECVRVSSLPGILWLGSLAQDEASFGGAIFEGVNFEDNTGTSFAAAGDLNGDGFEDFIINARYGKPFFTNPTGIGPGEAYAIYGSASQYTGTYNLNSIGTNLLRGVVFTGIRTPQSSNETDGMSTVTALPDLDGDGRPELMFSFPHTDSRGHNVYFLQDGATYPEDILCSLEKENQFLRGGVVIVSSKNSILMNPLSSDPAINLDLVGQDFLETRVRSEPLENMGGRDATFLLEDHRAFNENEGCMGSCPQPSSDNGIDTVVNMDFGFNSALAGDYITVWGLNGCSELPFAPVCGTLYCGTSGLSIAAPASPLLSRGAGLTGFYPTTIPDPDPDAMEDDRIPNDPLEPLGARIIGIGMDDGFGTSVALANATGAGPGQIIISAPNRTARGILLGFDFANPERGGEVDGLESGQGQAATRTDSGVAYLFNLRNLWEPNQFGEIPPKPHQYMVGQPSHFDPVVDRIPNIDAIRIAGQAQEHINNIVGIDDFNGDGRNDFSIGSPTANSSAGRVYVAFRRQAAVEGDYVLEKLAEPPTDPDRLDGVLIVSNTVSQLGASLVSGVDFNGDGKPDLVIGAPAASGGLGDVIVVFGDANLVSPAGGITVDTLLNTRNAQGRPRAARITGDALQANGRFGFNVANAGDVDGDGTDDLLVAAPNASPRFDPDPSDSTDQLSELGIDADFDGVKDDVGGPLGLPDGEVDTFDNLVNAGLVYVIFGNNRLDELPSSNLTVSVDELGSNKLRGFIIAGRRAGDRIGGGDAGDTAAGGIMAKANRGRSFGLASAGDVDNDGRNDILIGSVLADPRIDAATGVGVQNGGEAYLVYGSSVP